MGIFDDITCEHVLPAQPKPKTNLFKTKDFDCLDEHYTITQDGRLMKDGHDIQFHGSLRFETYTKDHMWFEYVARIHQWSTRRNSADIHLSTRNFG